MVEEKLDTIIELYKITPQQLLEIAEVLRPDVEWSIKFGEVIRRDFSHEYAYYEPHQVTVLGRAQLLDVVFALYKVFNYIASTTKDYSQAGFNEHTLTNLQRYIAGKDVNAILNLAHENLRSELARELLGQDNE